MKLHLYDSQGIVLVYFSDNSLLLCEKKREENLTFTANARQLTFTYKRQSATGKRDKMEGKL